MLIRRCSTRALPRWRAGLVPALLLAIPSLVGAATISVDSAQVTSAGEAPARLCVSLRTSGNERVAGTENVLRWDGDCATMLPNACTANSAHGKDLNGTLLQARDFEYKGIIISFSDLSPIPDGELYCCEFLAHIDVPGRCCRVTVANAGASDPEGNSIPVSASAPGQICLAGPPSSGGGNVGALVDRFGGGVLAPPVDGGGPVGGGAPVAPAGPRRRGSRRR